MTNSLGPVELAIICCAVGTPLLAAVGAAVYFIARKK